MRNYKSKSAGITLIALIVTIIVLLILAGISVQMLTGDNGILNRAGEAKDNTEMAQIAEDAKLEILAKLTEKKGKDLTYDEIIQILQKYFTSESIPYDLTDLTQTLATKKGNYSIKLSEVIDESQVAGESFNLANGKWNDKEGINTPKLVAGLIPVIFNNDGSVTEVQREDYKDWYDYSNKEWANAITKDTNGKITGYWVWIPRYEYKINSSAKTTTVKFIPVSTTTVDSGFDHIHPAFCNGSSTKYKNGEWDSELPGFWVAKFPAGYQQNTITDTNGTLSTTIKNSSDTLVLSNEKYTKTNSYTSVAVGTISTSTKMSLPVFLPLTYAYNCISIGDSYTLAMQISKSSSFYGLSENTNSHMLKNSEWGAVAYLTQSQYGRNGTEPYINNYYTSESSPYKTAVTGVYANGTNNEKTTTFGNAWYTTNGQGGSSTGNITGIYDLNGCVWERVAGYISSGNPNLSNYKGALDWVTTTANENGYQTLSSKYYTVYPYNSSSNSNANNWTAYKNLNNADATYGYGDAILETSTSGNGTSPWYSDYSDFAFGGAPFFARGGGYVNTSSAGVFCFHSTTGRQNYSYAFRVVLCP